MMKKVIMVSLSSMLITANTWSEEYYGYENYQADVYQEVGYQLHTYSITNDDEENDSDDVSDYTESAEFQETDDNVQGYEYQEMYDEVDVDNEVDNDDFQSVTDEAEVAEVADTESYLEGISVVGGEKMAYLSVKGSKIPVKEGETFTFNRDSGLGTWQVIRIKKESVVLKAQGSHLEEELRLHSRLPILERKEPEVQETTVTTSSSEENRPDDDHNTLYRLVRTPFGNFVVRDDAPITQTSVPKAYKPSNTNTVITQNTEEIFSENRVVQTPFGNFVVKEEK